MKPAVLLAIANDHHHEARFLRELQREREGIGQAFAAAGNLCEFLPPLIDPTFADLRTVFQEQRDRIAIFHFAGHADGLQLFLQSEAGSEAGSGPGVRAANLAEFLSTQNNLQLVFLNGCSTSPQVDHFIQAGVASVIATSQLVNDHVARCFATDFYNSLCRGGSIQIAYREAVAAGKPHHTGSPRGLYFVAADSSKHHAGTESWPWSLRFAPGAETTGDWNLPDASGNPLFGTPELSGQITFPDRPFKNLQRFERDDARIFFGRGFEIRSLYNKVIDPESPPVILYYGQSGTGKSSLLDAGLKPRLEKRFCVRYQRRSPEGLTESLRRAISPPSGDAEIAAGWKHAERSLQETDQAERPLIVILDQVEEVFSRPGRQGQEELEQLVRQLASIFLRSENRPRGKLVLGFRKEWLAEISRAMRRQRIPFSAVFLDRLEHRGVVEAIELSQAARHHFGLAVEPGMADRIATDLLGDPSSPVAPTLQILLAGLWQAASQTAAPHVISGALYQQFVRSGLSLDHFVSEKLDVLATIQPDVVRSGLALDLLNHHATEPGAAATRTEPELRTRYPENWNRVARFLGHCQDSYLLIANHRDGAGRSWRLAHDTLGPLIRKRFDESVLPGQRARRILDSRIHEWENGETGAALDEADLATVQAGLGGTGSLNQDERRLVLASQTQRARNHRARRRVRIFGLAALLVIGIAGGLAWFSMQTARHNHELRLIESREKLTQEIQNEMQIGVAERDQNGNWAKAIHHFFRAQTLATDKVSDPALFEPGDRGRAENARMAARFLLKGTKLVRAFDLELAESGNLFSHLPVAHAQLDKSGKSLLAWTTSSRLTMGPDSLQVWDLATGRARIPVLQSRLEQNDQQSKVALAFAGICDDGSHFFTLDQRLNLSLYRVPAEYGEPQRLLHRKNVQRARFRPESAELVIQDQERIVTIPRQGPGQNFPVPADLEIADFAFDQHRSLVACGIERKGDTGKLLWYRDLFSQPPIILETLNSEHRLDRPLLSDSGRGVHWNFGDQNKLYLPDGQKIDLSTRRGEYVAVATRTNRKLIWSAAGDDARLGHLGPEPASPFYYRLPVSRLFSARFSEDGRWLATTSAEGGIVWDAITGRQVSARLFHQEAIHEILVDHPGRRVITCGIGGSFRVWSFSPELALEKRRRIAKDQIQNPGDVLSPEAIAARLPGVANAHVTGGRLNQAGDRLVTWGSDGVARVWDLASGKPVTPAMHHQHGTGAGRRALRIHGARFAWGDRVIVTWTGLPVLRGGDATLVVPGTVQFRDATSGLPLAVPESYSGVVEHLEFDPQHSRMITRELIYGGQGDMLEVSRPLPGRSGLPDDVATWGELATGSRLNAFDEFEIIPAARWRSMWQDRPASRSED